MSTLLLLTGIVLVAVPLIIMIGFAAFIFLSFMKDDDMTAGIVKVGFLIMAIGTVLIVSSLLVPVS
jgi:hypothetical protein